MVSSNSSAKTGKELSSSNCMSSSESESYDSFKGASSKSAVSSMCSFFVEDLLFADDLLNALNILKNKGSDVNMNLLKISSSVSLRDVFLEKSVLYFLKSLFLDSSGSSLRAPIK